MEQMLIQEIMQAMGVPGTYTGAVGKISTDSRDITPGCLFLALTGERFNGHDYISKALESGAAYAVAQERRGYGSSGDRVVYVPDTQQALMEIARAYRMKFPIRCVGVTGSVGKTTTKDMIAEVVSAGYRTLKTWENLNNEIGLSKTLLELNGSHEAAVIEMGMQGLGEIKALARVARPSLGVITNIGVSHLEQLGTRENILKAKLELAEGLADGAPLFLCGDNDLLAKVKLPRLAVTLYGIENPACRLRGKNIRENLADTTFILCDGELEQEVTIPCIGRHNVCNALAAYGVGRALHISPERCVDALRGYTPSGMRQKMVSFDGYTVMEDCYNASPDSMRAALETLAGYPCNGRRIAVLADMLELGEITVQAHTEIGTLAAELGIDYLLAYGELAAYYAAGVKAGDTVALHVTEQELLIRTLRELLRPGDVVWFKGSHGMHLECVLQGLYSKETNHS